MRQVSCHAFLYTPHIYPIFYFKDQGRTLKKKKKKKEKRYQSKVKIIIFFKLEL